ncbi:MAG TPA: preprotein translocase subunit SecE [Longimicrobiaceae bacterium]|nr:preprotein translocase subunit SecE [Longimicrobiaceae bacterium]
MAETTRTSAVDFFGEVRDEIKKVTWPDREQLRESTVVIVIFVAIVAATIFVMDWLARIGLELIASLVGG